MKTKNIAALAAAAGLAIATFGPASSHAQTAAPAKAPAVYISEFEVTDAEGIRPYSQQVEATFTPFSGRYIARGGKTASLEGEPPKRIVIIGFDSLEQAQAWYDSPGYRAIRPIRHKSATSRVYIVEGVAAAGTP